eukprot:TRINITY_DN5475_c1_g1_i1.p1 TRINITY_DN5475_c1_g1~~TRINITY_DN5475_c1_g1_i1.p1  ORF type:complete len:181 (+),score=53.92 TRINITY_DN5475_c1_g1_i1:69-545(+)
MAELVVEELHNDESTDAWHELGKLEIQCKTVATLDVTCEWRDQGWGNQKGDIKIALERGGELVCEKNAFGICRREEDKESYDQVEHHLDKDNDIVSEAKKGDIYKFLYVVGGGGGHELHIKNFKAQIVPKGKNDDSSGSSDDEKKKKKKKKKEDDDSD